MPRRTRCQRTSLQGLRIRTTLSRRSCSCTFGCLPGRWSATSWARAASLPYGMRQRGNGSRTPRGGCQRATSSMPCGRWGWRRVMGELKGLSSPVCTEGNEERHNDNVSCRLRIPMLLRFGMPCTLAVPVMGTRVLPLNLENDQNDELTNHVSGLMLAAGATCRNPNAQWNSTSLSSFSRPYWHLWKKG